MGKRFEGKVVWITGGGSGIGLAIAVECAEQGADVAVSGRRKDRLDEAVVAVEAAGGNGFAVPCDVTNEAQIKAAVKRVVDKFGKLDVAIANAGFSVGGKIIDLSAEDWRRQFDVNVVGAAVTCRHALPELAKTGGRIGLICSVSGMLASPGFAAYTASKYALRAIGQCLSMELHGTGVSCTLVHPGFVESEIAQVDNQGQFDPNRKDKRPAKLMWKAEPAARVTVRAIHRRKREFVFTGHGKFGAWLGRHVPSVAHLAFKGGSKDKSSLLER